MPPGFTATTAIAERLTLPFPNQNAGVSLLHPLRKITLDIDGMETVAPSSEVFEWQEMANGPPRLLIAASPVRPNLFRELAGQLAEPLFLLYILHTPRGEGDAGRYQSSPLMGDQIDDFLIAFTPFLAGDARHDIWAHSQTDGRTLIWDRHDLIFAEGDPLDDIVQVLEAAGYRTGSPRWLGSGPHLHHYRAAFDRDASAVLAAFDWTLSALCPEDEQ